MTQSLTPAYRYARRDREQPSGLLTIIKFTKGETMQPIIFDHLPWTVALGEAFVTFANCGDQVMLMAIQNELYDAKEVVRHLETCLTIES